MCKAPSGKHVNEWSSSLAPRAASSSAQTPGGGERASQHPQLQLITRLIFSSSSDVSIIFIQSSGCSLASGAGAVVSWEDPKGCHLPPQQVLSSVLCLPEWPGWGISGRPTEPGDLRKVPRCLGRRAWLMSPVLARQDLGRLPCMPAAGRKRRARPEEGI